MYSYINGKIVNQAEASILPNDLGLLRGYAIFDYLRTYNGKPFLLHKYLTRFNSSAAGLGLTIPFSNKEIEKSIIELLTKNKCTKAGIRLLLTGGYAEDSMTSVHPNFIILIEKLQQYPLSYYEEGIKLISYEHLRQFPEIKTTNYLTAVKLMPEAKKKGAVEILYHFNGKILEATRSNFFIVKNKAIITPSNNILHGITRKVVVDIARKENYSVLEADITWNDLKAADEAFITGTTKKIMPVVKIDDIQIGDGAPGIITQDLMRQLEEYIKAYCG